MEGEGGKSVDLACAVREGELGGVVDYEGSAELVSGVGGCSKRI